MMLGAVGTIGCGPDDTTTGSGGASGTGGTGGSGGTGGGAMCPDDPAEGPVPEECGIWVSVSQGDDAKAGTQGEPVATLTRAIELAAEGLGRVYACGETWTETLTVPSGVSLHGGFNCDDGWAYVGEARRAMVTPPSQTAITWIDGGNMNRAWLTDVYVEAIAAVEPGGSSIAVFVRDELPITVKRCELVAGDGADGADGVPGSPDDLPATAGAPGNNGADACSAALSLGGAVPENACDPVPSKGGKGGDSSTMLADNGEAGEPAGEPPAGAGGLGEQVSPACTAGISGAAGQEGKYGPGAQPNDGVVKGFARLLPEGIVPFGGEDGKSGTPGQGGGGGGATFGIAAICGGANTAGAAGGSGGAGGCGGKGGGGGQGGGWSVAFATRSGATVLDLNTYRSGNGGKGGDGGALQPGGSGGSGGAGGKGSGAIGSGCAGGKGGNGGDGGLGGGGSGGWSVSIARLTAVKAPKANEGEYVYGDPGLGGSGFSTPGSGSEGNIGQFVAVGP